MATLTINTENLSECGENVQAGIVDGKLVIVVDPKVNLGPSSSGKMNGVASTGGFTAFPGGMKGNLYLGKKA